MTVTHPLPGAGSPLAQVFLFISHCTIRANGTMCRRRSLRLTVQFGRIVHRADGRGLGIG